MKKRRRYLCFFVPLSSHPASVFPALPIPLLFPLLVFLKLPPVLWSRLWLRGEEFDNETEGVQPRSKQEGGAIGKSVAFYRPCNIAAAATTRERISDGGGGVFPAWMRRGRGGSQTQKEIGNGKGEPRKREDPQPPQNLDCIAPLLSSRFPSLLLENFFSSNRVSQVAHAIIK